jgi:hypothetical protein
VPPAAPGSNCQCSGPAAHHDTRARDSDALALWAPGRAVTVHRDRRTRTSLDSDGESAAWPGRLGASELGPSRPSGGNGPARKRHSGSEAFKFRPTGTGSLRLGDYASTAELKKGGLATP